MRLYSAKETSNLCVCVLVTCFCFGVFVMCCLSCEHILRTVSQNFENGYGCGVAATGRLLKIIGLFCKRDL